MKLFWIAPIMLAGALAVGCTDDTADTAAPAETAAAPAEEMPAEMPATEAQAYSATLAPGDGIESTGTGTGAFTYDPSSMTLEYTITYEGLSGPAGAAHIHGPADPGANAPPVVPFADAASPITGTATLTEAQAADLMAGKYYVNVHTAANPGGEIRGQIMMAH